MEMLYLFFVRGIVGPGTDAILPRPTHRYCARPAAFGYSSFSSSSFHQTKPKLSGLLYTASNSSAKRTRQVAKDGKIGEIKFGSPRPVHYSQADSQAGFGLGWIWLRPGFGSGRFWAGFGLG